MPTYEYSCTSCGHRLEAVQKFSDDPLTECPECGSALRKVYGAVGIVLKGSGFYKTDSRAAAKSNGSKSDVDGVGGQGSAPKSAEKADAKSSDKGGDSQRRLTPSRPPRQPARASRR